MKQLLPLIMVLPALAACAAAPSHPVPQSVRLSSETMTVALSDGTLCVLEGWQRHPTGRLEPCGPGYGYAVEVEARPNVLRQILSEIDLALTSGRLLSPMAEVTLTDPSGVDHSFSSPDPAIE